MDINFLQFWPVIAGVLPAAVGYGMLWQKVKDNDDTNLAVHQNFKESVDRNNKKIDDIAILLTEIRTDVKWLKREYSEYGEDEEG
jgi:hypothetical protein